MATFHEGFDRRVTKSTIKKVIEDMLDYKFTVLSVNVVKQIIKCSSVRSKRRVSFVRYGKKVIVEFSESIKEVMQYMECFDDSKKVQTDNE